jgi:hypothetical protein
MESVGMYIIWHPGIFTAIWCVLWPFCLVCGHLVYFYSRFGMVYQEKIWQPCLASGTRKSVRAKITFCHELVFTRMNVLVLTLNYALISCR